MNNPSLTEVLDAFAYLPCQAPYFKLGQSFPSFDHLAHSLIVAKINEHIDIIFVFKLMLELDNIIMMERLVDLYLIP